VDRKLSAELRVFEADGEKTYRLQQIDNVGWLDFILERWGEPDVAEAVRLRRQQEAEKQAQETAEREAAEEAFLEALAHGEFPETIVALAKKAFLEDA